MKIILLLIFTLIFVSCTNNFDSEIPEFITQANIRLDTACSEIDNSFGLLQEAIENKIKSIKADGLTEENIRKAIVPDFEKFPFIIDQAFIDSTGILKYIEPVEYSEIEGSNIGDQKHILKTKTERVPVLSASINTLEGMEAMILTNPIIIEDKYMGSFNVMFDYIKYFKSIFRSFENGVSFYFFVADDDGEIFYSSKGSLPGINIYNIDDFKVGGSPVGFLKGGIDDIGAISITGKNDSIEYRIFWRTIRVYDRQWKIFMSFPENYKFKEENIAEAYKKSNLELENLSNSENMISAIANNNEGQAVEFMDKLYRKYPNLYCIAFVNKDEIIEFGYPEEVSLKNYKFQNSEESKNNKFLNAVRGGKKSIIRQELIEGGMAEFYLCPVKSGDEYLGMLYSIFLL